MSQCVADDQDILQRFPATVYQVPKFVGTATEESFHVPGSAVVTVKELNERINTHVYRLLVTARSSREFDELRQEVFPEFVELSSAVGTILLLDKGVVQAGAVEEAFSALWKCLKSDEVLFGGNAAPKNEALFCLDALFMSHVLAQEVMRGIVDKSLPSASLSDYQTAISQEWWSLLHLRCILFAIQHQISPTEEVLHELLVGFRHAVMSYAAARVAMEPRYASEYAEIDFSELSADNEDAFLAADADREYSFVLANQGRSMQSGA